MKTRCNDVDSDVSQAEAQTLSANIETVANEVFTHLNDSKQQVTGEIPQIDPQYYLRRVAAKLMPKAHRTEQRIVHAALQKLPSLQREALLLHLGGLTYPQIADKQRRSPQIVLKDLANAYAHLRFQLERLSRSAAQALPPQAARSV